VPSSRPACLHGPCGGALRRAWTTAIGHRISVLRSAPATRTAIFMALRRALRPLARLGGSRRLCGEVPGRLLALDHGKLGRWSACAANPAGPDRLVPEHAFDGPAKGTDGPNGAGPRAQRPPGDCPKGPGPVFAAGVSWGWNRSWAERRPAAGRRAGAGRVGARWAPRCGILEDPGPARGACRLPVAGEWAGPQGRQAGVMVFGERPADVGGRRQGLGASAGTRAPLCAGKGPAPGSEEGTPCEPNQLPRVSGRGGDGRIFGPWRTNRIRGAP
jgi:hypothetical protein